MHSPFYHEDGARMLAPHGHRSLIEGIVKLTDEPDERWLSPRPSIKPGHFYTRRFCMRAEGWIELGSRRYGIDKG